MDGIKVTVEEKKVEERAEYPCFKIGKDGTVVLFYSQSRGVVIASKAGWGIGKYSSMWAEEEFEPFHGTIKIEVE